MNTCTRILRFPAAAADVVVFITLLCMVFATPPEDPIQCAAVGRQSSNCTITNSIGAFPDRTICRAARAAYPMSEAELVSAVAEAVAAGKKIKVGTRYSHSIPKLVCPDGADGVLISTRYLNRTLEVNTTAMTMTVESGVTLRQLMEDAAAAKLALPYAPYWWGVTVGGMIGTGAHGSSLWGAGSQVHDYVVGVRIVTPATAEEGYAKVRVVDAGTPEEMDAVRVSLGVLGVISRVTLKLQPLFKRSIAYIAKNDLDFGKEAITFGRQHEFADFMWYPSQKIVIYRVDDRVSTDVPGSGTLDFTGFRSTPTLILNAMRSTEETQEALGDVEGKCINGRLTTSTLKLSAYGLTNNGIIFTGYPVIGFQNRVQASGKCLDSPQDALLSACPWDYRVKGLFYHQTTFSIALTKVQNFIEDVQKLIALESKSLCGLDSYNGILGRYVTTSTAFLGKEEDALDFDITYYRSKNPQTPRLFEDILEEIEQMAMFKYDALPHWGKNRNVAFLGVINKFKNATKFLEVKQMYDPKSLFSSDWTNQILGLKDGLSIMGEGCALEGLCICSEDVHCAPKKGYFCQPGKVYKEARVCTKSK